MTELKELSTIEQWKSVFEGTNKKPIFVFKHSTTCPISASAYDVYKSYEIGP
ncbi:monothiol bacilliredoxin BrxC family protein [Lederbergia lenta]|uniref:monothiol bacilliredoxin BrxC family protein n=1 Tax=Lederbergia lenta TaxID=1467 RepID=UPI0014723BEC